MENNNNKNAEYIETQNEFSIIVERKDVSKIDELLRKNIHPDELKDHRGLTILGHSIVDENYTLFKLVLKYNPNCKSFLLQDGTLFNPFLEAVERGQEKIALAVLERGCEYNVTFKNKHIIYEIIEQKMFTLFKKVAYLCKDQINELSPPIIHYIIPKLVEFKEDHWKVLTKEFLGADSIFDLLDLGANPNLLYNGKTASEIAKEVWAEFLDNKKYCAALAAYITLEKAQLGKSLSIDLPDFPDKLL